MQKQLQEKRKLEQIENEKNLLKHATDNDAECETNEENSLLNIDPEKTLDSLAIPAPEEPNSEQHLSPALINTSNIDGEIHSVACGSQHTVILTRNGALYTLGRNLEGQLGLGSRTSVDTPTEVTSLRQECICEISAGADFTVAVSDSGTVFGWGSNAAGQLGKAPIEADGNT